MVTLSKFMSLVKVAWVVILNVMYVTERLIFRGLRFVDLNNGAYCLFNLKWRKTMKLKLIALSASTAAMMAMPGIAFADSPAEGELDFTGERACECTVDLGQNAVLFGQLDNNGEADTQSISADVFCNQPSEVSFTSENGYMLLQASNPANEPTDASEVDKTSGANPGFSAGLDYNASITGTPVTGDTTQLLAGTPAVLPFVVPALNASGVSIDFDTIAESQPLLGGTYEDTLTITISPLGV